MTSNIHKHIYRILEYVKHTQHQYIFMPIATVIKECYTGIVFKVYLSSFAHYFFIFMVLLGLGRRFGPFGTTLLHNKVVDIILSCIRAFMQSWQVQLQQKTIPAIILITKNWPRNSSGSLPIVYTLFFCFFYN